MRRALLAIVTTAGATLGLAAPAAAGTPLPQTHAVDDDGFAVVGNCDSTTPSFSGIQAALTAAAGGDTIDVCPGTYPEQVTVEKQVTLLGAQDGVDARDGRPGANESIVRGAADCCTRTGSFGVVADGVTIDGFTVQEASTGFRGISLGNDTSGSEIRNNIVQDNSIGLTPGNDSATEQTVIEKNLFQNNNSGISSNFALQNVLIDQNHFLNHDNAAISFTSTTTGGHSDVTISANTFDQNGRALLAVNLVDSTFTNNEVTGSTSDILGDLQLFHGTSNLDITQNLLSGANNGVDAVHINNASVSLPNPTDISLSCNSIDGYGPTGDGLEVAEYDGPLVAEGNWWGEASGPTNAANPGGTGERIVDLDTHVDFTPWLVSGTETAPATTGFECTPNGPELCSNSIDDDGDALVNGADPECAAPAPTCFGSAETGGPTGGNDVIFGTNAANTIKALTGSDKVCSRKGNDNVQGDPGHDRINTAQGGDVARGNAGNDEIDGGDGTDNLNGGDGNDELDGGDGANDRCTGGAGFDTATTDCEIRSGIEQVV